MNNYILSPLKLFSHSQFYYNFFRHHLYNYVSHITYSCVVELKLRQGSDMFRCGAGQQADRDGGLDDSFTGSWGRRDGDLRRSRVGGIPAA